MIAAPLSHLGKHTPLLPFPECRLPNVYVDYLEFLRTRGMHPEPPFMHAFILGDLNQIPFPTQLDVAEYIQFKENNGTPLKSKQPLKTNVKGLFMLHLSFIDSIYHLLYSDCSYRLFAIVRFFFRVINIVNGLERPFKWLVNQCNLM